MSHLEKHPSWPKSRNAGRRGFSAFEVVVLVGVTLPLSVGLFFLARTACGRLFQVIETLVSWPSL
ncbi:MAG: hypothetical protein K8U03_02535 [Planctomycetia bacterium]|nr:hypothetical protein [Planctomycetia bacterium]